MAYHNLITEQNDAVLTITINRPDKLNALNLQTIEELQGAFDAAAADNSVRVVVITGSGDKAFVAGADISEINQLSPFQAQVFSRKGQSLMLSIERLGKPVIGAINGYALGGGCELALACTLRVASERARFGQPEIKLGIIPGFGGTQRVLRVCGKAAALELCLLGETIDAKRAQHLGLVNRVIGNDSFHTEVQALAATLAASAPLAMRGILNSVNQGGECSLDQGLVFETEQFALCCASSDMREGTTAFLEKRVAKFAGN